MNLTKVPIRKYDTLSRRETNILDLFKVLHCDLQDSLETIMELVLTNRRYEKVLIKKINRLIKRIERKK